MQNLPKTRITHISTVHPHNDPRILYKECTSLHKTGYEVYLIIHHNKEETINGVKIINLPQFKNRFLRIGLLPFIGLFKALKLNPSIYHFHDPEFIPCGLILRILSKKVIYDVHEDVPAQILSKTWIFKPTRLLISKLFNILEKFSAKYFSAVVAATPYIATQFQSINPHTIVVSNYALEKNTKQKKINFSSKKSICYIGGITEERGILNILKAIETLPVSLELAGSFKTDTLERCIKNMPAWGKVHYHGFISHHQLNDILSSSFAGLAVIKETPNYINSYATKIFEYMAAGLPVISSNFPIWKEIIEGNQCGICVNPNSIEEIREAILYLFNNINEASLMGERGRVAVKQKYRWEQEYLKLEQLYNFINGALTFEKIKL